MNLVADKKGKETGGRCCSKGRATKADERTRSHYLLAFTHLNVLTNLRRHNKSLAQQ